MLSDSGRKKITHYLPRLTPDDWLFVAPEFAGLETSAHKVVVAAARAGRRNTALAVIAMAMHITGYVPVEALQAAARLGQRAQVAEENLRAIEIGVSSALQASET